MEQLRLCDPEAEHADQLVQLQVSLMQDGDGVGVGFGVGDGGGIVVDDFGITIFRPFFNSGIKSFAIFIGRAYFNVSPIKTPLIAFPSTNVFTPTTSPA